MANVLFALCSAIMVGLGQALSYYVETRSDGGLSWPEAISRFVMPSTGIVLAHGWAAAQAATFYWNGRSKPAGSSGSTRSSRSATR